MNAPLTAAMLRAPAAEARPVVLFVSPVSDLKGGAERVLLDLLDNPAIRPALAVPEEGELAAIARARCIPLHFFDLGAVSAVHRPPRPGDLLRAARAATRCTRQLAEAARATGAALVHTNGLKVHVIGAILRRLHGIPVIAHIHDIPHTRFEQAIWRGVVAGVTRTVMVSRPCFPGKRLPVSVRVLANGIDAGGLPDHPARAVPECPVIGFVGRFHRFKGLHLLLDWFEHAAARRPALRLLIRGRADAEGRAYWEALQPRIAALQAAGRCEVVGWAGPGADPYDGIDVLAVPSDIPDPCPRVVIEAALRGVPAIGYPAGGIPGLIGSEAYGALARTPEEFTRALDRLLASDVYGVVSAAAAARARAEFSLAAFWGALAAECRLALPERG